MKKLLIAIFLPLVVILWAGTNLKPSTNPLPASPAPTGLPDGTRPAQSDYTFAVISDIHADYDSLQKALDFARADGVSFIIVAGDLTTVGAPAELQKIKAVLAKNNLPYYVVPGNHDLWSKGGLGNFTTVFGPDFQFFQKGEVKFILINNADGSKGVGEGQQEWLDQELADCFKLYCLVFAHMPLNHPYFTHVMGEGSPLVANQAAELVKKLTSHQVKKLFAGHVHYFSSYELDGLKTHTDGAVFSDKGTVSPRFLEITVSGSPTTLEEKEVWVE
ncbi:hypothetical protein COT65_01645 [Candidatus Shapirobacteria bacterium CG09_land_8_20_14_0_10_47_13]|uniref:Calcineurin-like phosphoesterase domain-containing protein n=1 Tax=Candidatus Shapirobacteria bacterium CG09_land_8_20_14_0_10_47_13 TaxID=1974481 RepID=A0A2H0WMQ6_9BACT|nr:MAG: hypothetical protein COT65_01645 [Candidatus Shapirobacteria bacterium CG09_land_8_20_14_0_10_47_13]